MQFSLTTGFLAQSLDTVEIKLVRNLPTSQSSDNALLTKSVQTLDIRKNIHLSTPYRTDSCYYMYAARDVLRCLSRLK